MEQAKYYYYHSDGILVEEVTLSDMRDMVEAGELSMDTLVCETKTQQWQSVSEVLNLPLQSDDTEYSRSARVAKQRRRMRSSGTIERVPLFGIWFAMGIVQMVICMLYALSADGMSQAGRILIVLCSLPVLVVSVSIGLICKTCQTYLSGRK